MSNIFIIMVPQICPFRVMISQKRKEVQFEHYKFIAYGIKRHDDDDDDVDDDKDNGVDKDDDVDKDDEYLFLLILVCM